VKLFTARYADYDPTWGIAVRTSVGVPKGWRHGPLEHVRRLTPYGLLHVTDRAEFTQLYIERLERVGVEAIFARFEGISDAHDCRPLVLLCFEDVRRLDNWCHRTILGAWLRDRLDIEVPELDIFTVRAAEADRPQEDENDACDDGR
jgi:hypothetical protein